MRERLNDSQECDDPLLSVINLIDIFLVLVAALLLSLASNPLNTLGQEDVTLIRKAGTPEMEIVTRRGDRIERFAAGHGSTVDPQAARTRAGIAYRLPDGSLVYVPD